MIINHGGISGGKDSTALMLWMVNESGYPRESLDFTFCDTGNEDEATYAHVAMLSERIFPIRTLKPALDFWQLSEAKHGFPSAKRRYCTQVLKMHTTTAYLQTLWDGGRDVLLHSGVRASESTDRAKLPRRGVDEYFGCDVYRPLIDWSIEDVWAMHKKYGIARNPLYDIGCSRVGCFPCVMSRKRELILLAMHRPERVAFLRQKEAEVGSTFFHRTKTPLRYRSRTITTNDGRVMAVPTIDDVMQWARDGAWETGTFDFDDLEEPPTCSSRGGFCE